MPGKLTTALAAGSVALAIALSLAATAFAEGLPDLTLTRKGPATVAAQTTFIETIKVTNKGTAATPGVEVDYEPNLSVYSTTKGVACYPIMKGHSGRGGGYTQVGWSCVETLKTALAPKGSVSIALAIKAPAAGTLTEHLGVQPYPTGPQLNLSSHVGGASITVVQPPLPGTPTALHASRVSDNLQVGWTPAPATAADLTSSRVTATPVGGSTAPVLSGTGGPRIASVGPAVPNTTYRITVVNYDAAGASAESEAIEYTTAASTVKPGAPREGRSWWLNPSAPIGSYLVGWAAPASPGDSQIEEYEIQAVPLETEVASTIIQYEPASSRETEITGNSETPWTVTIRARNAAGWGAWSAPILQGGV